MRTRFDPLLRLREQAEDDARQGLATALRRAEAIAVRLEALRAEADAPHAAQLAALWELVVEERARHRAAIEAAEAELGEAEGRIARARAALDEAYRRAEALRRAVEAKREAARAESARAERKELDALAGQLFANRRR